MRTKTASKILSETPEETKEKVRNNANNLINKNMAWSKVNSDYKKPLRWWLHKILCEYGWIVRNKDNYATYHHHLKMCFDLGYNLYGEKVKENNSKINT